MRVGQAMSPPLIKKVLALRDSTKITIMDAPPGTSCPVIETMKPADFILLVTEPTPFGLNDLKLAVGATEILNIPCGLVINRSDLGDERVKEYADSENLPVLFGNPLRPANCRGLFPGRYDRGCDAGMEGKVFSAL